VYFIMITLAFAQMLYYLVVSLKSYGGEDGLPLSTRSLLVPGLDLKNDTHFYFVALAVCVLVMLLLHRCDQSRFGRAARHPRQRNPHGRGRHRCSDPLAGLRAWPARWPAWPARCWPT
jgi:branched-chain amino acid transport system permease protein